MKLLNHLEIKNWIDDNSYIDHKQNNLIYLNKIKPINKPINKSLNKILEEVYEEIIKEKIYKKSSDM